MIVTVNANINELFNFKCIVFFALAKTYYRAESEAPEPKVLHDVITVSILNMITSLSG